MAFSGSTSLGSAHGSIVLSSDLKGVKDAIAALEGLDAKSKTFATNFSSNMARAGQSATDAGKKLSLGLTAPLTLIGGLAIAAASDLNEATTAVENVFGTAAGDIEQFATSSAENLGISEESALAAAVQFAGLGKAAGLSGTDLADFSKSLETTSADLGSFFNEDPTVVLEALRSGLVGESEPLRRFNILISEAAVQQEAVQIGIAKTGDTLTEQQKVMARYSLIIKGVGDAQGDFAETSDGVANSSRQLQADIKDLEAEFGQALLPVVQTAIQVLRDVIAVFRDLPPEVQTAIVIIGAIAAVVGPALIAFGAMATALAALTPALATAGVALLAFTGGLAPLIAIIGTVAGIGVVAKIISDTGQSADAATLPVKNLSQALLDLALATQDATSSLLLKDIAAEFEKTADTSERAAARATEAMDQLKDAATKSAEIARALGEGGRVEDLDAETQALFAQRDANNQLLLSEQDRVELQQDLIDIEKSGAANRVELISKARLALETYNGEQMTAEGLLHKIDLLAAEAHGKLSSVSQDAAEAAHEQVAAYSDLTAAASKFGGVIAKEPGLWAQAATAAQRSIAAQSQALDDAARDRARIAFEIGDLGTGFEVAQPGATGDIAQKKLDEDIRVNNEREAERLRAIEEAKQEQEQADREAEAEQQRTLDEQARAQEQYEADHKKMVEDRAEAERAYSHESVRIESDRIHTIRDTDAALEKSTRDANVARIQNERDLSQSLAEIEADRVTAIQESEDKLADLAQERSDAAVEAARQKADIEAGLQQSLADAQQSFNDDQRDNLAEQADIHAQLADQLKAAAATWREADKAAIRSIKDIRAELQKTLQEGREEFARLMSDMDLDASRSAEDFQRNLEDLDISRGRINEDLATDLADPNLTEERRAELQLNAARQLEDLDRRQQELEIDRNRELQDAATARNDAALKAIADEQAAQDAAHQKILDQKQEQKDADQAYHDQRKGLEEDAAKRIGELQSDLAKAASDLRTTQAGLRDDAVSQIQDVADQEAASIADLKVREQEIYDDRAKAFEDLEARKTEAFRTAEQGRTVIAREEQQARDVAARDQDQAERSAQQEQRKALRVLNRTNDEIDNEFAEKHGTELGTAQGDGVVQGLTESQPKVQTAGETLAASVNTGAASHLTDIKTTGVQWAQSFIDGVLSRLGGATSAGAQLSTAAEDGLRDAADMHSQSKKFFDLGANVKQSYVAGLLSQQETVAAAMAAMANPKDVTRSGMIDQITRDQLQAQRNQSAAVSMASLAGNVRGMSHTIAIESVVLPGITNPQGFVEWAQDVARSGSVASGRGVS